MVEEGLVAGSQIHQVGIRGFVRDGGMDFASANGINAVSVEQIRSAGCNLRSIGLDFDTPCYISFDIDAVDPAYAPGTGTPVPGGLTSSEVLYMVDQAMSLQLVGFDLVEIAPVYDSSGITALLGAHIIMETLVAGQFVASHSELQNDS